MRVPITIVYEYSEYPRYVVSTDARYLIDKLCMHYNNSSGAFQRDMFVSEVIENLMLRAFFQVYTIYAYCYNDEDKFRIVCKGLDRQKADYSIDFTFYIIEDRKFFRKRKI